MVNCDRSHKVEYSRKGGDPMENRLRGAVLARFKSITSFANAMEWDRKKASRIVNRVQQPTVNDMEQMADCLDILDADSFLHIFLPSIPTKWESKE